jgi:hypothetical protein
VTFVLPSGFGTNPRGPFYLCPLGSYWNGTMSLFFRKEGLLTSPMKNCFTLIHARTKRRKVKGLWTLRAKPRWCYACVSLGQVSPWFTVISVQRLDWVDSKTVRSDESITQDTGVALLHSRVMTGICMDDSEGKRETKGHSLDNTHSSCLAGATHNYTVSTDL